MSDWRKNDERHINETLKESEKRLVALAEHWTRYKVDRRPKVITVDGKEAILV